MGRAVIAMTAIRIRACVVPGKVTGHPDIRPPTDVMAITSLPHAPAKQLASGCREYPRNLEVIAVSYLGLCMPSPDGDN